MKTEAPKRSPPNATTDSFVPKSSFESLNLTVRIGDERGKRVESPYHREMKFRDTGHVTGDMGDTSNDQVLMRAFAPLHRSALGLAFGIVLGSLIFLVTVASIDRDSHAVRHVGLLSQFFVGYSVSLTGALVGLVWGFVTGYVLGWAFALLRNLAIWVYLVCLRSRTDMEQYSDFLDHM